MLASLGEAYVGQLARAVGAGRKRVLGALVGREPDYRPELGLVALGLAEAVQTANGRVFRITRRGMRKARSLTARGRASKAERLALRAPVDGAPAPSPAASDAGG